jgi:aspartyl-tRNA(Asn)/glutamyl-tRNA(Gln) amidotransferase subunit C
MAKITEDDVLNLAKLSRLQFSNDELSGVVKEIEAILGYVEQLQTVNLSDYKPTYQVTGLKNVMRPDEAYDYGVTSDELLKNAPATEKGYIKVRRVLE